MSEICIAVHDNMLAAALSVPRVLRPLRPQETLLARNHWYQAGSTPYPAWYFFGCRDKGVEGIVSLYAQQGFDVWLTPVTLLSAELEFAVYDVQFCSLPFSLYSAYRKRGKKFFGYLPETLSSKAIQAEFFIKHGGERYLPPQKVFRQNSCPSLPPADNDLLILKSTHGSAGRSGTGQHYTVWQREPLAKHLPHILADLPADNEVICSEFVLTADPYADGADHVVHKMHFISCDDEPARPYGAVCQRFIHRCNWQRLHERGWLPLPEFIGIPQITTGHAASVSEFAQFTSGLAFHTGRLIFSADFIVPPDGVPRFLESNKLAATFAEQFDSALPPIIDAYGSLPI